MAKKIVALMIVVLLFSSVLTGCGDNTLSEYKEGKHLFFLFTGPT